MKLVLVAALLAANTATADPLTVAVTPKQPLIGAIGMSGDADGPHLHYQLQDGLDKNSEALPSYFKLRWIRGKASSSVTVSPESGDIVEN